MLTIILLTTAAVAVLGTAAMYLVPRTSTNDTWGLTWPRIASGALACMLMAWGVTAAGFHMARASAISYEEYWSGLEDKAWIDTTTCTRDGSCVHEYDCDSYVVMVTKTRQVPYTTTETYTDANGRLSTRTVTKYRTETYTEPETRWHSCPYVTHEYSFKVSDTLGDTHTIGSHWFPASPTSHRWTGTGYRDARFGFGQPSLPNVESGQPGLWVEAKKRLDAGTPGGVTKQMKYDNYILASADDIYAKASDQIAALKKDGLLPTVVTGTYDFYRADKVYGVGDLPGTDKDWQDALLRFNGHFGGEKQGDMHLVVVTDDRVSDPDSYTNALMAYWQSEALGKHALSKNGYVVVVGSTDDQTVAWARGFSGMPLGNEAVNVAVREDLTGTALTPTALLGTPAAPTSGAIGAVMFDESIGFERVQMVDYEYLFAEIEPSGGAKTLISAIIILLGLGIFFGLGMMPVLALAATDAHRRPGRSPRSPFASTSQRVGFGLTPEDLDDLNRFDGFDRTTGRLSRKQRDRFDRDLDGLI